MKRNPILRNSKKILVIATGDLGSIALSLAAIEAIRDYHQHAHIVLMSEPECARFLNDCPYFDELVVNWRYDNFREDLDNRSKLQAAKFDAVYDLSCTQETAHMFKRFWPQKPLWSGVANNCSHPHIDFGRNKMHLLDRQAEQLWLCGIGPSEGYPLGASPLPNFDWVYEKIAKDGCGPHQHGIDFPYAILLPETSNRANSSPWPNQRFIELGNSLLSTGIRSIIAGDPSAISNGNEIRANIPNSLDMVARLDLFEFMAFAKSAKLIVGSDGALNVISGIIGAPTISIINPNSANIRQVAPRGPLTVSLVSRDFKEIKTDQVLAAARAVM